MISEMVPRRRMSTSELHCLHLDSRFNKFPGFTLSNKLSHHDCDSTEALLPEGTKTHAYANKTTSTLSCENHIRILVFSSGGVWMILHRRLPLPVDYSSVPVGVYGGP